MSVWKPDDYDSRRVGQLVLNSLTSSILVWAATQPETLSQYASASPQEVHPIHRDHSTSK